MSRAVALVTGATSGIGHAAARHLAAAGLHVVIVGRTPEKAAAAAAAVAARRAGTVDALAADFADLAQVRALAAEAQRRLDRLDVLVNNAGTIPAARTLSPEGVESAFAVNHLAPFLLTALRTSSGCSSAPARVVTVASTAHERGTLDFDDLAFEHRFLPFRAYARSKLANVLFATELARRLQGTGVTSNAFDPGLVRTKLGRGNGALRDLAWAVTHVMHRGSAQTPDEAGAALAHLCTAPELATTTGAYFRGRRRAAASAAGQDPVLAGRLWTVSEALTGRSAAPVG